MLKSFKELNEYRFSGHMVLIGKRDKEWQDRDYVLGNFGKTEIDAINAYKKFIRKGFDQGSRPELTGGGLIRSAGGWASLADSLRQLYDIDSDWRRMPISSVSFYGPS